MHLAASQGSMDALKFLINLKGINLSPEDRLGGTPLADAIRHKHQEAQKLLRERGAQLGSMDVSVRLCEAGASNDLDALKTYVRNGADLNSGDYDQRTALHLAASMGHLAAVSWILDNGVNVNVNVLDRMKCTPLDDANREGHKAGGRGDERGAPSAHPAHVAQLLLVLCFEPPSAPPLNAQMTHPVTFVVA